MKDQKQITIKKNEIIINNKKQSTINDNSFNKDKLLFKPELNMLFPFKINENIEFPTKRRRRSSKHYINNEHSRIASFLKRRKGMMKKAYELAITTNSQVLFLCVCEKNKTIYTFTTHKFKTFIEDFKDIISEYLESSEYFHPEQTEFFGVKSTRKGSMANDYYFQKNFFNSNFVFRADEESEEIFKNDY